MLKLLNPKKKPILGIDISSSSIKILQINKDNDKITLEAYASELIPEKATEGNVIKDIDAVSNAIKRALSYSKFTAKQAVMAVPDSAVITKQIQLNEGLSDDEMEELVVMEADKYIPYPIDEINIDFQVLGTSSKNSSMLDVLVVASRAENVSSRSECVSSAGLEPIIMEVESYAIERAVKQMESELPAGGADKIIATIDIGALYTHLFVLNNMNVIFTREEEFGGHLLSESISQAYNVSIEKAKEMLYSGELPEDYKEKVESPFQETMLMQVKRTLQFFYSTSSYSYVDHIILAGGMARQKDFIKLIQKEVGVPVTIANPFINMEMGNMIHKDVIEKEAPALIVASGLAMRSTE